MAMAATNRIIPVSIQLRLSRSIKESNKLHWAKEIKFGDQELNTLNYNIRILGRKGVLLLNFIAGMNQLELINSKREAVLAMAEFKEGSRYENFQPDMDKVAA